MNEFPTDGSRRPPANLSSSRRTFLQGAAAIALLPALSHRALAADGVIKIGQVQALTGPSAEHGVRARDGATLAAEEINAAGGIRDAANRAYRLELLEGDMVNDPRQAITLLRNYAADPDVLCVLGPTNSVGFLPMTPVAEQFSIPLIGNGSGAPIKQWNTWAYRVNPTSLSATPVLLKTIVAKHGIKRLAILVDQTSEVHVGDAEICRNLAGELDYEVVADEAYSAGNQDFAAQITKIRFAKPDALFLAATPGDGAKAALQIDEAGLGVPLITGFGAFQDPVYWDNSRGTIANGYTWIAQDLAHSSGALSQWTKTYNERFRFEATIQSAFGYDSVYAVANAIATCAEPTRDELHRALMNLNTTTPIRTSISFKNPPTGDNLTPTVTVIQVTGRGEYVAVS
ncbi:ABC transporter substrate-binding protein [Devosia sp.]|uniref:ABC transporter substrate-binding protein n=1 Tax=Devosia sp. TaxID=1871048 RepID=UPI002EE9B446